MSSNPVISSAGRPLTPGAVALMLMLCLSWGFNQVAVKLALPDIPPMLQATIRSSGALIVLFLIARLRGVKLFERDGTLRAGLLAGVIFGVEFVLIYRGLLLTSASHMPRAMATFQKAGWNVAAYPVDFRAGDQTPWSQYSLALSANKWQLALHEWLGLMAYRVAGQT